MKKTLYIVMPTYNEQENIKNVIKEWYPILENGNEMSRLVVSDGGSTDKTLEILQSLQREYPQLVVIPKPGTDHGTKVIFLYKYAIENGADWIFQTDSDGQTVAEEFHDFWELRESYDIILGNRKKRGDGPGRKAVENVLRAYLRLYFGVTVPDANAPFRLMKACIVNKYIDLMPSNFNLPNAVLAACFSRYKENVTYRVITFQPRQGGKNYMNLKRIFRIGLESIGNFAQIRKNLNKYEESMS